LFSDLYYGSNSLNQIVFTWVAQANTTDFTGDVAPLLQKLAVNAGPTSTDYLGYVAFGSEAYSSPENVTLYVPKLQIDVQFSQ
jgi:Glycosyl hydrolase family 12